MSHHHVIFDKFPKLVKNSKFFLESSDQSNTDTHYRITKSLDWVHSLGPLGYWATLHGIFNNKKTLIFVIWEQSIWNWLIVSVQGVRKGLQLIIIDCWTFHMLPFFVCFGIQDQIIGLTTDTSWRKDIWTLYCVFKRLLRLPL